MLFLRKIWGSQPSSAMWDKGSRIMASTARKEEMMAHTPPPMMKKAKGPWDMMAPAVTLRFLPAIIS